MSDDRSTFEVTRARREDIVVPVRRKDVSLEQSLDLLEEAVRLVNQCNDLIDQTSFRAAADAADETAAVMADDAAPETAGETVEASGGESEADGGELVELMVVEDGDVAVVEFVDMDLDGEDDTVMLVTEIEDDERS
jgi:exodeoxyribonuclease VII small subunit